MIPVKLFYNILRDVRAPKLLKPINYSFCHNRIKLTGALESRNHYSVFINPKCSKAFEVPYVPPKNQFKSGAMGKLGKQLKTQMLIPLYSNGVKLEIRNFTTYVNRSVNQKVKEKFESLLSNIAEGKKRDVSKEKAVAIAMYLEEVRKNNFAMICCFMEIFSKFSMNEEINKFKTEILNAKFENTIEDRGNTTLHKFLEYGNYDACYYLINEGADIYSKNSLDLSVWDYALLWHRRERKINSEKDIVRFLLEREKNVFTDRFDENNKLFAEIFEAVYWGNVVLYKEALSRLSEENRKKLFEFKRDQDPTYINGVGRDKKRFNILHYAIANNKAHMVKLILQECPELIYEQSFLGVNALHLAAMNNCCSDIIEELRSHSYQQGMFEKYFWGTDAINLYGYNAFFVAATYGELEAMKKLLKFGYDLNRKWYGIPKGCDLRLCSKNNMNYQEKLIKEAVKKGTEIVVNKLNEDELEVIYGKKIKGGDQIEVATFEIKLNESFKSSLSGLDFNGKLYPRNTKIAEEIYTLIYEKIREKEGYVNPPNETLVTGTIRWGGDQCLKVIKWLWRHGVSIVDTNENLETPLMIAVKYNCPDTVQWLISVGAPINAQKKEGDKNTALHIAVERNLKNIVAILLRNSTVDLTIKNKKELIASELARDDEMKEIFRTYEECLAKSERERLIKSIVKKDREEEHEEEFQELFNPFKIHKTMINLPDQNGQTLMHYAAVNDQRGIVLSKLVEVEARQQRDNQNYFPANLSAIYGNTAALRYLFINRQNKNNFAGYRKQTPLHHGIVHKHEEFTGHLLLKELRKTIDLFYLTSKKSSALHLAAKSNNVSAIRALYDNNFYLDIRDEKGDTALHSAVKYRQRQAIECLIELGSNLNIKNAEEETPLHCAVYHCSLPLVRMLRDKGGDPDLMNNYKKSVRDLVKLRFGIDLDEDKVNKRPVEEEDSLYKDPFDSLVFQGGSVKGVAYLGALETLTEKSRDSEKPFIDLSKIQGCGGASAGSITALLLGLNYNLRDIENIVKQMNFEDLLYEKKKEVEKDQTWYTKLEKLWNEIVQVLMGHKLEDPSIKIAKKALEKLEDRGNAIAREAARKTLEKIQKIDKRLFNGKNQFKICLIDKKMIRDEIRFRIQNEIFIIKVSDDEYIVLFDKIKNAEKYPIEDNKEKDLGIIYPWLKHAFQNVGNFIVTRTNIKLYEMLRKLFNEKEYNKMIQCGKEIKLDENVHIEEYQLIYRAVMARNGYIQPKLKTIQELWSFLTKPFNVVTFYKNIEFLWNARKSKGFYSGERFLEKFENYVSNKTGIQFATFEEIENMKEERGFKTIKFVALEINSGITKVFSYETTPKMIVSDAVRCSMAIPGFFKPHKYYVKDKLGKRIIAKDFEEELYVDGGVNDNYPIWLFKSSILQRKFSNTLGFRLVTKQQKMTFTQGYNYVSHTPIVDIKSFLFNVVKSSFAKQDSDHNLRNERDRTVYIDTIGVGTLEFDITPEKTKELIDSGKKCGQEYIDYYKIRAAKYDLKEPDKRGKYYETIVRSIGFLNPKIDFEQLRVKGTIAGLIYYLFDKGIFKTLKHLGLNINLSDEKGRTALYLAAENDNHECLKKLLKFGAYVDAEDLSRKSIADVILVKDSLLMLELILEYKPRVCNFDNIRDFVKRCIQNSKFLKKESLNNYKNLFISSLHQYLLNKKLEEINFNEYFHADFKVDINDVDSHGNTILHLALENLNVTIVDALKNTGVDFNKKNGHDERGALDILFDVYSDNEDKEDKERAEMICKFKSIFITLVNKNLTISNCTNQAKAHRILNELLECTYCSSEPSKELDKEFVKKYGIFIQKPGSEGEGAVSGGDVQPEKGVRPSSKSLI